MDGFGRFGLLRYGAPPRSAPAGQSAIATHLESHISPRLSFLASGSPSTFVPLQMAFPRAAWILPKACVRENSRSHRECQRNSKQDQ